MEIDVCMLHFQEPIKYLFIYVFAHFHIVHIIGKFGLLLASIGTCFCFVFASPWLCCLALPEPVSAVPEPPTPELSFIGLCLVHSTVE